MRVLNWALDAQKTVGGKIISVILSVALIFSFSNFFYGDNAFADTEEEPKRKTANAHKITLKSCYVQVSRNWFVIVSNLKNT